MSAIDARFGHVNVTGRDWRRLAAFYTDVFGCEFVPPERDIRSADLDAATGLHDAHLTGAHLRLPGHGDGGPTLEIFEYDEIDGHPGHPDQPTGLGSRRVPGPGRRGRGRCRRCRGRRPVRRDRRDADQGRPAHHVGLRD